MTEARERRDSKPFIRNAKHIIKFSLFQTPLVQTTNGHFLPTHAEVSIFPKRASVNLIGRGNAPFTMSTRLVLFDDEGRYERASKRQCPDWLIPLLREAGYEGKIDG